jgi:glycosyltransferase involved in cell wall biosynthesis
MRIGVDATCWQNNRGYGRHARALLNALVEQYPDHSYRFFLDSPDTVDALPGRVERRLARASAPATEAASANDHRSVADMWRMGRTISREELDVMLFPTVYSFVPVVTKARKLVIIHDVIAETFPQLTHPRRLPRMLWKLKVALGRWQADGLITVSEYSRRMIAGRFGVDPARIFVVGEASDPVFRRLTAARLPAVLTAAGVSAGHRLIVYVGGFGPHKNLIELVDCFAGLTTEAQFADTRLMMVGEFRKEVFHSYFSQVRERVEALGIADRVVFPGYMSDEDLVQLLNLAAVLALPSLMEGFGLPAVEAAACGCPVIATTASPLPDLLGDAGVYITPGSGQLAQALRDVLRSAERRARMGQAGLEAAGKLTWNAAAHALMRVMNEVGRR